MTTIAVMRVSIPALSTIGYGYGTDIETGDEVKFAGDHRPMRHLGEAMQDRSVDDPIEVEVESYQVLERRHAHGPRA